jgi:hypothetical protein
MKKLICVVLLALAFGLAPASRAADAPKANETPTVESGNSSKPVTQGESKHKKKHHHHKKEKKGKEGEQPKA